MKKTFCVFVAFLFSSFAIANDGEGKVDVYAFDIAGVKLGMSLEEAKNAVKETYQVTDKDIEIKHDLGAKKTDHPKYFTVERKKTPREEIIVYFDQDIFNDREKYVVSSVSYHNYTSGSEAVKEIVDMSKKKFGKPMEERNKKGKIVLIWCDDCGKDKPYLMLTSQIMVVLTLADPRYELAIEAEKRKENPPKF